jgi:hypothetical protein
MEEIQETRPDFKRMIGGFVRNPNFILVICGLVASFSFLMLVSFLALGWIDTTDNSTSGFEIWMGSDGTLSIEKFGQTGLGSVRFIDRLLIIVPLGAITLITLAGMIITRRMPTIQGLVSMVAVGLVLFFFPFFWQSLSSSNWQGYLEEQNLEALEDTYNDFYSTGEQKLFGFLVSVVSIAGLGLWVADRRSVFETVEYYDVSETERYEALAEGDVAEYEN